MSSDFQIFPKQWQYDLFYHRISKKESKSVHNENTNPVHKEDEWNKFIFNPTGLENFDLIGHKNGKNPTKKKKMYAPYHYSIV